MDKKSKVTTFELGEISGGRIPGYYKSSQGEPTVELRTHDDPDSPGLKFKTQREFAEHVEGIPQANRYKFFGVGFTPASGSGD